MFRIDDLARGHVPARNGGGQRSGLGATLFDHLPLTIVLAGMAAMLTWWGFLGWWAFRLVRWLLG